MTPREMVKFLKKNGFIEKGQRGSHKKMFNPNTKKITIVPMHNKDLGNGLEASIKKQAGLKWPVDFRFISERRQNVTISSSI